MKKVVVSLVSAAALAMISAGMAGGTESTVASSSNAGFYVGGNLGYGHYNDKQVAKSDRNGFAYGVDLGYQFNPYFALEGGYLKFGNQKVKSGSSTVDADLYALDLLAKGIYPVTDQFDVFGKAGIARLDGKVSSSTSATKKDKVVPMLGVGVDYNVNEQVAVDVEGLYTMGAKNSFRQTATVLAGISYKFNDL